MSKNYKHILIIVLSLIFLNCSSDDNSDYRLNPPEWLIGTWTNPDVEQGTIITKTIIVSSNDIILIDGKGEWVRLSKQAKSYGQPIEENNPDSEHYSVYTGVRFLFELISDNQVKLFDYIYTK